MARSIRVRLSVQLTKLIKVFKQERSQSATNGAHKKARRTESELVCINYQPGKTRMAAVYEITLPAVRIEPIKAVTSLLVNIKLTRSRETSKNITVYLAAW